PDALRAAAHPSARSRPRPWRRIRPRALIRVRRTVANQGRRPANSRYPLKFNVLISSGVVVRVHRGLPKSSDAPLALTIGNFDGVHRGHQAMLSRLIEGAEDLRLVPAVLTFEPHPREFFAPHTAPPRLSTLRTKLEAFRAFGVAISVIERFDARLASLSPEAFVHQVLEKGLNARWVLVGDDFRFGKGRAGDIALLRSKARQFSVEGMRTVAVEAERASSTAVRAALADGDLAHAAQLLGRPYA